MKFSGNMCFMIILKVTKNQGFTLSLEDKFFEKPQRGSDLPCPSCFRVNADLYFSDRLHLVEKGNLKLSESIFNLIEVSNEFICRNHNNKLSKSCKMVVSFKLNNTNFPPLPFPPASKPVSSISASLRSTTASKPFNINI